MSTLMLVEQSTPATQASTQQVIYPKLGSYARMDSTGVEKVFLDSNTYAAATGILNLTLLNFGV